VKVLPGTQEKKIGKFSENMHIALFLKHIIPENTYRQNLPFLDGFLLDIVSWGSFRQHFSIFYVVQSKNLEVKLYKNIVFKSWTEKLRFSTIFVNLILSP
jgi:hypothetical protein